MEKQNKFISFFKKYGYYLIAGALVVAIGLTLILATREPEMKVLPSDENIIDVGTDPVSFTLPMNDLSVLKSFSDSELLYNKTMNHWEAHKSYDFTSSDLSVFAVASGVVSSVSESYMFGTCIEITHNDGFKTLYASLDKDTDVKEGDKVDKGQKIGTASDTAANESEEEKHLHFEMFKDNTKVDPSNYLNLGK